tara:strand:+ start:913 stop:1059 length:147 start_codon:yes stop_codon:yes gene_type:complete
MEEVIKTIYTAFYQKTIGVTYQEQVIVTLVTIGFALAIIIPLIGILIL